jgi:hypothetical protein
VYETLRGWGERLQTKELDDVRDELLVKNRSDNRVSLCLKWLEVLGVTEGSFETHDLRLVRELDPAELPSAVGQRREASRGSRGAADDGALRVERGGVPPRDDRAALRLARAAGSRAAPATSVPNRVRGARLTCRRARRTLRRERGGTSGTAATGSASTAAISDR